jgi:hypothetical protein
MFSAKVFTVDEANAFVPLLKDEFEYIINLINKVNSYHVDLSLTKEQYDACATAEVEIKERLLALSNTGLIVQNISPPVVDVCARHISSGRLVHLCWHGEDEFCHWHACGFGTRMPIKDKTEFGRPNIN